MKVFYFLFFLTLIIFISNQKCDPSYIGENYTSIKYSDRCFPLETNNSENVCCAITYYESYYDDYKDSEYTVGYYYCYEMSSKIMFHYPDYNKEIDKYIRNITKPRGTLGYFKCSSNRFLILSPFLLILFLL